MPKCLSAERPIEMAGDDLADVSRPVGDRARWVAAAAILLLSVTLLLLSQPPAGAEVERFDPWVVHSHWGWLEGDRIEFYDLGRTVNTTAPVYRLVDASGDAVEGQRLIFQDLRSGIIADATPSDGYSDFHRVWDVRVPDGYVPETWRSLADLVAANLTMTETDLVWNTPMVPAGSALVGSDAGLHPLMSGWWDGVEVHYLRFESSRDHPAMFDAGSGLVVASRAMAVFDPPGQLDIVDTYPDRVSYSPLTRLYIFNPISTEYVADSVRSWDEAEALGFPIFPEGRLYNRPLVGGREARPRFGHAEPTTYDLLEAWSGPTSRVLYYDMGPMVEGEALLYRFVTAQGVPIITQHHIVGTVAPGILLGDVNTQGYATTWRFVDVVVVDEASFEPDLIKSVEEIEAAGFTLNETGERIVAPMVTKGALFRPLPSNPPGEGVVMVWYRGTGVYLNVLDPDGDPLGGDGTPRTTDLLVVMDPDGDAYEDERPILRVLPSDEANYSVVWSVVEASGGDGYRPGRFRTRQQLVERSWTLEASGYLMLGGYVAGPLNVPAWRPDRFNFTVGPVLDEDGRRLRGVDVRVSRDLEVVTGRTGRDGTVTFEVDHTWNGETVRAYLSKAGYDNSDFPAEIVDYERFVPSGGYVPPMVGSDVGGDMDVTVLVALAVMAVIVLAVIAMLAMGRRGEGPSITEEEADEIFSDGDGGRTQEGEGTHDVGGPGDDGDRST